jgi:hypothetical protein
MTKRAFLLILILLVFQLPGFSGNVTSKSATISGFVRDARNGETLTGAVIYPEENPTVGITTNSYGYYSLSLPVGKY